MNRTPAVAALILAAALVLGASWWLLQPTPDVPIAPEPAPAAPIPVPAVVPVAPLPRVVDDQGRTRLETDRVRRDDLPKLKINALEGGRELHQQVVKHIQEVALTPCVPRASLTLENRSYRAEVDYFLQPTGVVELQLQGVEHDRSTFPLPPAILDCVASKLGELDAPGVQGELHQRFVFAWSAPVEP